MNLSSALSNQQPIQAAMKPSMNRAITPNKLSSKQGELQSIQASNKPSSKRSHHAKN
jgi:hypothetical protein